MTKTFIFVQAIFACQIAFCFEIFFLFDLKPAILRKPLSCSISGYCRQLMFSLVVSQSVIVSHLLGCQENSISSARRLGKIFSPYNIVRGGFACLALIKHH